MKVSINRIATSLGIEKEYTGEFALLGLVNSNTPGTLTYIDTEKFIPQLLSNENITGVIATKEIASKITNETILVFVVDEPRYHFFTIYNALAQENYKHFDSIISPSAKIHPRAYVSANNVIIGDNVIVGANASILADVEIGNDCIIREGAVLGSDYYEFKKTSKGILSVIHDGKLLMGEKVYVGNNATIYKGFAFKDTKIGDETKIENLVEIAHGTWIGKRCFLIGHAMVCGSCEIGDDVWIGPGAIILNQVNIGNRAVVSIGSVVTKHVKDDQRVTGNFAIDHQKFLDNLKKKL